MKRNILLAFFIVLLPNFLHAQAPVKLNIPTLDLGLKIGGNFAKLSGDTWENGYKASFLGGAFAGLRGSRFGVQVELFYSQANYTVNGNNFYDLYSGFYNNAKDSAKHGAFRVNYLNIPVLFQIKLIPMVWLQIGPQYSGITGVNDVDNLVHDAKSVFKSGDISGVAGVEVKLPFHLNAGARYILGFSSLNGTNISGAWQSRTLQIHVGYRII